MFLIYADLCRQLANQKKREPSETSFKKLVTKSNQLVLCHLDKIKNWQTMHSQHDIVSRSLLVRLDRATAWALDRRPPRALSTARSSWRSARWRPISKALSLYQYGKASIWSSSYFTSHRPSSSQRRRRKKEETEEKERDYPKGPGRCSAKVGPKGPDQRAPRPARPEPRSVQSINLLCPGSLCRSHRTNHPPTPPPLPFLFSFSYPISPKSYPINRFVATILKICRKKWIL